MNSDSVCFQFFLFFSWLKYVLFISHPLHDDVTSLVPKIITVTDQKFLRSLALNFYFYRNESFILPLVSSQILRDCKMSRKWTGLFCLFFLKVNDPTFIYFTLSLLPLPPALIIFLTVGRVSFSSSLQFFFFLRVHFRPTVILNHPTLRRHRQKAKLRRRRKSRLALFCFTSAPFRSIPPPPCRVWSKEIMKTGGEKRMREAVVASQRHGTNRVGEGKKKQPFRTSLEPIINVSRVENNRGRSWKSKKLRMPPRFQGAMSATFQSSNAMDFSLTGSSRVVSQQHKERKTELRNAAVPVWFKRTRGQPRPTRWFSFRNNRQLSSELFPSPRSIHFGTLNFTLILFK